MKAQQIAEVVDTALVYCGACHWEMRIALGLAHAIVCAGCGREITLGESERNAVPTKE